MIKSIFFDMGNVMFNFSHRKIKDQIKMIFGLKDFDLNNNKYKYLLKLFDLFEEGRITEDKIWISMKKKKIINTDSIFAYIFRNVVLKKNMVRLVKQLKLKGYGVFVISNVNPAIAQVHFQKKHYELFDNVFLSYKIKSRKPSPIIFLEALKKTQTIPRDSIFIDDNYENVKVAKKLGMNVIWYKNFFQLKKEINNIIKVNFNKKNSF